MVKPKKLADKNRSPKRMFWARPTLDRRLHIFDAGNGGIGLCGKWHLYIDPDDPGAYSVTFIDQTDDETPTDCQPCWAERRRLEGAGLWRK